MSPLLLLTAMAVRPLLHASESAIRDAWTVLLLGCIAGVIAVVFTSKPWTHMNRQRRSEAKARA